MHGGCDWMFIIPREGIGAKTPLLSEPEKYTIYAPDKLS
jgi:hypothetical protein